MRYQSARPAITKNSNRRSVIERISSGHYEKKARDLNMNGIRAAGFEMTYYSHFTHGTRCTCTHALKEENILDDEGNLSPESMEDVLDNRVSPYDNKEATSSKNRFRGVADYSNFDDKIAEFSQLVKDFQTERETVIEETNEDLNPRTVFDDEGLRPFTASISNCPVCNRTGFVGGYHLFGGFRNVFDVRNFFRLENCRINIDSAPYQLEAIDPEQPFSFRVVVKFPMSPRQVLGIRVMEGFEPFKNNEYLTFASVHTREENTAPFEGEFFPCGLHNVNRVTDGHAYTWRIEMNPTVKPVTHFEILGKINREPTFFDRSNYNRNPSTKSFNDVDSLSVSFPATLGQVRVRDIFFDRETRTDWIVTSCEVFSSSHTNHGFIGTAERIKFREEPYSLFNPYSFGYQEKI